MRRFVHPISLHGVDEGGWKPIHLRLGIWALLGLLWLWLGLFEGFRQTHGAFPALFTAGHLQAEAAYDVLQFQELAAQLEVPHAAWFGPSAPFASVFFGWCEGLPWRTARHLWLGLNGLCLLSLLTYVGFSTRGDAPEGGRWGYLRADLPMWLVLGCGPPLYAQFTTGSLTLFTLMLTALSFGLAGRTALDRRAWIRVGAPLVELVALGLACALEPLWLAVVPFRVLVRLDAVRPDWQLRALSDFTLPVLLAALFQVFAPGGTEWVGLEFAVGALGGDWLPSHVQSASGVVAVVAALRTGVEAGSIGAFVAGGAGFALTVIPWLLGLVMLRRVEGERGRVGLALSLIVAANALVIASDARVFVGMVGVAIFPWSSRMRPLVMGVAVIFGWLGLLQVESVSTLSALRLCLGLALVGLALWRMGSFGRRGEVASTAVVRERLLIGAVATFAGAGLSFLTVAGDPEMRLKARQFEITRTHNVVTGLAPLGGGSVAVSVLGAASESGVAGSTSVLALEGGQGVEMVLVSAWGASAVITPIYGRLDRSAKQVDLVLRVVNEEGVFIATQGYSVPQGTQPAVIELKREGLALEPWAEGYAPDPATGAWKAGAFSPRMRFDRSDGRVVVVTDIGMALGWNRLVVR